MSDGASILPDEKVFTDFKSQCSSMDNWVMEYNKTGMEVWVEIPPAAATSGKQNRPRIHKIKCKMTIKDVSAATMYDVLHDGVYRKTWDPTMLESFDIAKLSANADVGFYSWKCPKPVRDRDVVTLRSWQVSDSDYVIVNFSVKHPKFPPTKRYVRAISILTGYLIKPIGPNSCTFTYLSQADPKGALPAWLVNKASRVIAPKVMKCLHKAGQSYTAWKQQNAPHHKPWLNPEQSTLPMMDPAELSIQRADSLENVDETLTVDAQENEDSS